MASVSTRPISLPPRTRALPKNLALEHQTAVIQLPTGTKDAQLLSSYLRLTYPIDVKLFNDAAKLVIHGDRNDIFGAQNLALRFLGPESIVEVIMPLIILELCTLTTIRWYLAVRCRVIVTVRGSQVLILRGACDATQRLTTALKNLETATKDGVFSGNLYTAKRAALKKLCDRLSINFTQLDTVSPQLKFGIFDLLAEMELSVSERKRSAIAVPSTLTDEPAFVEAFRRSTDFGIKSVDFDLGLNAACQESAMASLQTPVDEPAFIEAFKRPKDVTEPAAKAVKQTVRKVRSVNSGLNKASTATRSTSNAVTVKNRLRPVIIDGANVAYGDTEKGFFDPLHLRCALDYFTERNHEDIRVILHGIRRGSCTKHFTDRELDRYFLFLPYRRLENQEPMIADDDSVILEFAMKRNAVIISNDQYRDWLHIRPEFREVIENRLVPFSLNKNVFVISHHPLGKKKPPLDQILCFND